MIVDTHTHTHTEGLSGHSSTAVHPLEPGDHCSSSLGLIRPAMCPTGPAQSCSHSFPFLPPPHLCLALEGRCPSRQSHSPGLPCTFCCFQGFYPELPVAGFRSKATVAERKPLCPSAPPLVFLGITHSPLRFTRAFSAGAIENACLPHWAFWSGIPPTTSPIPRARPSVRFAPWMH